MQPTMTASNGETRVSDIINRSTVRVSPRRVLAAVVGAALLTGAVGANGATTPTPQTGSATTAITLPTLTLTDPTGVTHTIAFGTLTAAATTLDKALASIGLKGATVAGSAVPDWSVQSGTSDPASGDHSLPVSTAVANGSLNLGGYAVTAADKAASATVNALTGTLTTGPLSTVVDLGQHGIASTVDNDKSSAGLTLAGAGGAIDLGTILPANVLNALPLSQLVTLAQQLGLGVPTSVTDALSALSSVKSVLDQLATTAPQLKDAQQQLATLLASVPSTQSAQQAVTAAQQQLATALAGLASAQQQLGVDQASLQSLQSALASATSTVTADQAAVTSANNLVNSLTAQLATDPVNVLLQQQLTSAQAALAQAQAQLAADQNTVSSLQQQVATATNTVSADQQAVTAAQQAVTAAQSTLTSAQSALDALSAVVATTNSAVAAAQALVDQLTTTLDNLLSALTSQVGSLPDLHAVLTTLVDLVKNAPVADLGKLAVTIGSVADSTGGTGSVTCSVAGLDIAGTTLPSACGSAHNALTSAASALRTLLGKLPVASLPTPSLSGLTATHHDSTAVAGNPATSADSGITPLRLVLPSMTLTDVTDSLVSSLTSTLGSLQTTLGGLGLSTVTSAMSGPLGTLQTVVGGLPTGATLGGLKTLGLDLSGAGVATQVLHYRALAAGGSTPSTPTNPRNPSTPSNPSTPTNPSNPGNPSTPGTPGTGTPTTPISQNGRLPFSGSDDTAMLGLGLVVALAGAHLTVLGRRRRPTS
jgi:hypothetical protein